MLREEKKSLRLLLSTVALIPKREVSRLRAQLIGLLLICGLSSILQVTAPLILRFAIDTLTAREIGAGAIAIATYAALMGAFRASTAAQLAFYGKFQRDLRRSIAFAAYERLFHLPSSYFKKNRTGEITKTIADGLNGVRTCSTAVIFGVAPTFFRSAIIVGALILTQSVLIAACVIIFALSYAAIYYLSTRRQRSLQQEVSQLDSETAAVSLDTLLNREILQLYNREAYAVNRIGRYFLRSEANWSQLYRARALSRGYVALCFAIAVGGALLLTTYEFATGAVSIGDMVLINLYLVQILAPVEAIGNAAQNLTQGSVALERLGRLLSGSLPIGSGTLKAGWLRPPEIEMRNVTFEYEVGRPILRNLNLMLPSGSSTLIIGKNGSGKSTIARLLAGLYLPAQGEIRINNQLMSNYSRSELRQSIAFIPQEPSLLNDTIYENLVLGAQDVSRARLAQVLELVGLDALLASMPNGLDTIVGERGMALSGGERQRLVIARSLLTRAKFYIFDEVTSGIDVAGTTRVLTAISQQANSATTLLISHEKQPTEIADRVLRLRNGTLEVANVYGSGSLGEAEAAAS